MNIVEGYTVGPDDRKKLFARAVPLRRKFHRIAELGFEEFKTAALVVETLEQLGIAANSGIGGTGVTAEIEGGKPGPTVLLRADMDGLRVHEDTGLDYASENPGLMHACGHDGHMASLLAAAELLMHQRDHISGRIRLLFQPGEEGFAGARTMIEHGVLDGVSMAAGLHLFTNYPCGKIALRSGPLMAATGRLFIDITGSPGHAAMPHQTRDALLAGAMIATQIQNVVSRRVDPMGNALVHIGKFQSGEGRNIVAGTASLLGSARWLSPELGEVLDHSITEIVNGVAAQSGCRIDKRFEEGLPALVNDEKVTEIVRRSASKIVDGSDLIAAQPSMYSEDMAFYLQKVPGCFAFVGAAPRTGPVHPHHHPKFDICEDSLQVAASLLAQIGFDAGRASSP